jgi:hypothetical protein
MNPEALGKAAGENPMTRTDRRVVDNRVFLLGLDDLYREAMKQHERNELLHCARETAATLGVPPADVPIEGYYSEDEQLTEYFRLIRALQKVPQGRASEVANLPSYQRLRQVTESPIFGPPHKEGYLLAVGKDALSTALMKTPVQQWTVEKLTAVAYECAAESTDFSLVALAALSRDTVVLAALRESVVLYVFWVGGSAMRDEPEYVWEVDEIVEQRAVQFVDTFNRLFSEDLPRPAPENARAFWAAAQEWKVVGRCVRIGYDDSIRPIRHYHWAIDRDADYRLIVREFWDTELWTTMRYREEKLRRQ